MSRYCTTSKRPKTRDLTYVMDEYSTQPQPENVVYTRVSEKESPNHLSRDPFRAADYTTFRGGWQDLKQVYAAATVNRKARKYINSCGWQRLFNVDIRHMDRGIPESLLDKWWDTTHTFHFPKFELAFHPYDFTFLTGIPIGRGDPPPFTPTLAEDWDATVETYLHPIAITEEDPQTHVEKWTIPRTADGVRVSVIKKYLLNCGERGAEGTMGEEHDIARMFFLWVIGQIFFPNSSSVVHPGWLSALDDVKKVHTFDWGGAIFSRLYDCLDDCSRGSKSFNGMWMVLEYWFYQYFRVLLPTIDQNAGNMDIWPRICAFNRQRMSKNQSDRGKHSVAHSRAQIEMRESSSIVWTPYDGSQHEMEDDIRAAFEISLRRVVFFDPEKEKGVLYLGDRCLRQLTKQVVIPPNPPPRASLSNIPYGVYLNLSERGWQPINNIVRLVSEKEYSKWWKKVSIGPLLPPLAFSGNKYAVGGASSQNPVLAVTYPPPIREDTFDVQRQQYHDFSDYVNWDMEVAQSGGGTTSIPIVSREPTTCFDPTMYTTAEWAALSSQMYDVNHMMRTMILSETRRNHEELERAYAKIAWLESQARGKTSYSPQTQP